MRQDVPYHEVKVGQLRKWHFPEGKNVNHHDRNFLVLEVDGVRVEVMNEWGEQSSYYVVWLDERSVLIESS